LLLEAETLDNMAAPPVGRQPGQLVTEEGRKVRGCALEKFDHA
jgi:hypothetical protein